MIIFILLNTSPKERPYKNISENPFCDYLKFFKVQLTLIYENARRKTKKD